MHSIARIIAVIGAVGCGTEYTPPTGFVEIYPVLFPVETKSQCNFCHALPPNEKSNGMLSMGADETAAYDALMSASSSMKCGGMQLVVPFEPESSLLWLKLNAKPPCGDRMPLGGSVLGAADLEVVRSWILRGAEKF